MLAQIGGGLDAMIFEEVIQIRRLMLRWLAPGAAKATPRTRTRKKAPPLEEKVLHLLGELQQFVLPAQGLHLAERPALDRLGDPGRLGLCRAVGHASRPQRRPSAPLVCTWSRDGR